MVLRITSLLVKLVVLLLTIGIVLGVCLYVAIHSENLTEKYLKWKIEQQYSQVQIDHIDIFEQRYTADNSFTFSDVYMDLTVDDERFVIEVGELVFENVKELLKRSQVVRTVISGLSIDSKLIQVDKTQLELFLNFDQKSLDYIAGNADLGSVEVHNYTVSNVHTNMEVHKDYSQLTDVTMDFSQGNLSGRIFFEYNPEFTYDFDFIVNEVELYNLQKSNKGIFNKVKGRINGTVRLKSALNELDSVYISLMAPEGISLRASAVKAMFAMIEGMVPYVPKFDDFPDSAILLQKDDFVEFDASNVQLENVDRDSLLGAFMLKSSKYNLDLDLTTDINVEDGLKAFFNYAVKHTN